MITVNAFRWCVVIFVAAFALTPHRARAESKTLTLDEAIAFALRTDPLLESRTRSMERSKLGVTRAQLDRFSLKIDGALQEAWHKLNIDGPTMTGTVQSPEGGQGTLNLAARLALPLFAGFRIDATVARSKQLEEIASADLSRAQKDIALSTAKAYWSVRRLMLLRAVEVTTLERLREAELVANSRVKAGLAQPIDVNRAALRVKQQEGLLAEISGQIQEASAYLAVLLGIREEVTLVDTPQVPEDYPRTSQELVTNARSARVELRQIRLQRDAQVEQVRIARSRYYPQLDAFGQLQYGNTSSHGLLTLGGSAANPFNDLALDVSLGVTLTLNFFDTLNTYTSVRDANIEVRRLDAEAHTVERQVDAEVRTVHARLMRLYAKRAVLIDARAIAEDNFRILRQRYENGDALMIEFLDGQIEYARAERDVTDVTTELHVTWLELRAALGEILGMKKSESIQ